MSRHRRPGRLTTVTAAVGLAMATTGCGLLGRDAEGDMSAGFGGSVRGVEVVVTVDVDGDQVCAEASSDQARVSDCWDNIEGAQVHDLVLDDQRHFIVAISRGGGQVDSVEDCESLGTGSDGVTTVDVCVVGGM